MSARSGARPGRSRRTRTGTRRRRRGLWVVVGLVGALVAWNVVERLDRPTPATAPPTLARSTPAGDVTTGPEADDTALGSEQARIAVRVEDAALSGDTATACEYDQDPGACASVYGGAHRYDLATPVSVVQVELLTATDGQHRVGVVVQRQIAGQTLQRKAFLLTADQPVRIVADDLLASSDAGKSLSQVFSEELR